MRTFRSSISKGLYLATPKLIVIGYLIGLFLALLAPPYQIATVLMQPFLVSIYLILFYPLVMLRSGRDYIDINADGFTLHSRDSIRSSTFFPWQALKQVKCPNSSSLQLLCSKEGVVSTHTIFPMDFPSGLVRAEIPAPLNQPEEFKEEVLKYAPADNPLTVFIRENPDYSFG